jgi:hypothetical protein
MTVVALAGRRVDAANTGTARFPLANVPLVRERVRVELEHSRSEALVCSGACGADLLAAAAAMDLGIRTRIVLPFSVERFRNTSVVDRPGDWGPVFDRVLERAGAYGDLEIVENRVDESAAYAAVNHRILDDAQSQATTLQCEAVAFIVWEGRSRGEGDLTQAFRDEALRRRLRVIEVRTLDDRF